jgi:hypothetical protein
LRLAAATPRVGGVWTEENRFDLSTEHGELTPHFSMHGVKVIDTEQSAAQSGLVGRHDDPIPRVVESRDRFEATGNGYPLVHRFYIGIGILIDDSVSVEDDDLDMR